MESSSIPSLYFDGQFIDVLWDNYENSVQWFKKYFNWNVKMQEDWKVDPRCVQGKMTQMDWGTWLATYLTNSRLPHHYAERGTVEGNVRLCFRTGRLEEMHRMFSSDAIRVSPIYDGPKTRYFDVWATPEGFRLTMQEDSAISTSDVLPSWIRIGVSNLDTSINWYQKYMGMKVIERSPADDYVVMSLKLNHSEDKSLWVLEKVPEGTYIGKIDGQVQPYCWIHHREDFFSYHQYLVDCGVETSDIGGFTTKGLVGFHFYDLDGNRMNIKSM